MNTPSLPGDRWILLGVLAIECAVIVILATLARGRVRSGAGQRTVWQVAMLALAAALAVELSGAGRSVAGWVRQSIADSRPPVANAEPRTVPFVPAPVDVVPLSASKNTRDMVEPDQPLPLVAPPKTAPPANRANQWAGVIWLLGFGILAGRIGLRRLAFASCCREHREHSDLQLTERTQALARALGFSRPVRLLESAECLGPIAFGLGRPTIALPPRFTANFSAAQQDAMLAHELAHLAARDPAWYLLADLVSAALWWHPLVWLARRRLQTASELAADEASRIVTDGPAALAESLVKLGAQMTEQKSTGGLGVEGKGFRSGLGQRVERLLQMDGQPWRAPHRLKSLLAKTCGPAALALAAVLCGAWAWPQALLNRETPFTQFRHSWQGLLAAVAPAEKATDRPDGPARRAAQAERAPAGAGIPAGTNAPNTNSKARQKLLAKLDQIQIAKLSFDRQPLTEVVKFLTDECRKQDPEKQGVNFIINPHLELSQSDPSGHPYQVTFDLENRLISIKPPIHDISLCYALDAICRAADQPIQFIVEDYAVVFNPKPAAGLEKRSLMPLSGLLNDIKLLYETKLFDQAEAKCKQVMALYPKDRQAGGYLNLIHAARDSYEGKVKPEVRPPEQFPTPPLLHPTLPPKRVAGAVPSGDQRTNANARLAQVEKAWQLPAHRNLLPSPNPYVRTNVPNTSTKLRQKLLAKLDQIQVEEVFFDGMPLGEVVKWLSGECKKLDPEKKGVNFILNPFLNDAPGLMSTATNRATPSSPPLLDAFGNPIAVRPQPSQRIDLEHVLIKVSPPLHDLTLHQALDVICKMADRPIHYLVEDYAVVFLPKQDRANQMFVRTYKVDPNTFMQGLQSVTGVPLPSPSQNSQNGRAAAGPTIPRVQAAPSGAAPGGIRSVTRPDISQAANQALRQGLALLGLKTGTNAASAGAPEVLFNDRNGMLTVRATLTDLETIEHAIGAINAPIQQIALDVQYAEVTRQDAVRLGFAQFLGTLPESSFRQKDSYLWATNRSAAHTNTIELSSKPAGPPPAGAAKSGKVTGAVAGILKPAEFKLVMQALERNTDVKLQRFSRMNAVNGRQAQVQAVEMRTVVTGVKRDQDGVNFQTQHSPFGPVLDIVPSVGADGFSVQMSLMATVTEFLGYVDPKSELPKEALKTLEGQDPKVVVPLPKMRSRQTTTSAVVWDGQTVLLAVPSGSTATDQKTLFFFITPTLIDPAGNRLHTDEELSKRQSATPPQAGKKPAK